MTKQIFSSRSFFPRPSSIAQRFSPFPPSRSLCRRYQFFLGDGKIALMKPGPAIRLILALSFSLSGPAPASAQSQQEPLSVETPSEEIEVELHPVASILTAVNIPARAALCGLNTWLASLVTFFSAGMRYADAAQMMEDGCSGPWIITPEMLEENKKKEKSEPPGTIPGGDMVLRREPSFPAAIAP